jgi:hypothetical protein
METQRIAVYMCEVVNASGVWSAEGVASLAGQTIKLTGRPGDRVFTSLVHEPRIEHGWVVLEMDIPDGIYGFAPVDVDWWTCHTVGHHVAQPGEP